MSDVKNSLVILWSSRDRDVALNMVFMYALNAKKHNWWQDVHLIVWGPSAKLLSEDQELQAKIVKMKEAGVVLEACKACSDKYGVTSNLERLGIDVKYIGKTLTDYIKEGRKIITF
jgi:hypothetical protein